MPGGDQTGPMGMGPMTGRGLGACSGFRGRGFGGGGFGMGRGGGRGWRNMYYATGLTGWQRAAAGTPGAQAPQAAGAAGMTPEDELQMLKQQAEAAQATLQQVRARIDELAGQAPPSQSTE